MLSDRSGDRPRGRRRLSESEEWIFEATEELLAEVPLHDITVAMISDSAGVSRATFYTYFSSKFAVIIALLEDVMQQIVDAVLPFLDRDTNDSAADALRKSFESATDLWVEHRMILRAASENWHAVPELGEQWTSLWDQAIDITAQLLDQQRETGIAPPGPPSRQLASTMLWGAERAMYIAGLRMNPDMPGEKAIVESLVRIWHGAFYAAAPEDPGPAAPKNEPPKPPRGRQRAPR
jgi:TetR/AcrR family transcriptional regulator, ethionamide resistance regulator